MFYVLFYIFRSKFGVGGFTHWPQQGKVGYALLQFSKGFKIIHLITKPKYFHKPKYLYLWRALVDLRQLCISRNLKKIVMPKIACGLDKKNYKIVRCMIAFIFYQCPMEIIICKFQFYFYCFQDSHALHMNLFHTIMYYLFLFFGLRVKGYLLFYFYNHSLQQQSKYLCQFN